VMTAYNDLRFLDEAVDSVLRQDLEDLELIVVDDGNDDKTPFSGLQARDPRIRVVVNPTNMGTAAAANRGIDHARSDIIVRLDADDTAEPARIGRLVSALEEDPDLGLVGSAVTFIDEEGLPRGMATMPETEVLTVLRAFLTTPGAFERPEDNRVALSLAHRLISSSHFNPRVGTRHSPASAPFRPRMWERPGAQERCQQPSFAHKGE
jgi:glycosyltransferase involved in cell wall biosynthesis